MGWRPLFTSWLSTLPKTFSEGLIIKLTSFFERYVDTCLKFVRNEVRVNYLFQMEKGRIGSLKPKLFFLNLFYFTTSHILIHLPIFKELCPTKDTNLVKSLMNLIECMIDDLREKEKVDQMIPENLIDLMEVLALLPAAVVVLTCFK